MSYGDYRVTLGSDDEDEIRLAVPVLVSGPNSFFLLAIWEQRPYGRGVRRALAKYAEFIKRGPPVVAGGFNQNEKWDEPGRERNHSRTVELLGEVGLASAYHHQSGEQQGRERPPTYWHGPTGNANSFHIDYCFGPKPWLGRLYSVEVGSFAKWVASGLSDHAPLVIDVSPI